MMPSALELALRDTCPSGEFDFAGMPFDKRPDLLREALDQPPPQTRQCVNMRLLEELDSVGIAVKARLVHAGQLLRLRIAALREGNR